MVHFHISLSISFALKGHALSSVPFYYLIPKYSCLSCINSESDCLLVFSGLTSSNYTELSHLYEKYKTQGKLALGTIFCFCISILWGVSLLLLEKYLCYVSRAWILTWLFIDFSMILADKVCVRSNMDI